MTYYFIGTEPDDVRNEPFFEDDLKECQKELEIYYLHYLKSPDSVPRIFKVEVTELAQS